MQPKTICTVRTVEILPNGDAEDDAADGTARADRYIGCREKFIMLAMFNWHLSNNNHVKGGNNFLLRPWRWREGLGSWQVAVAAERGTDGTATTMDDAGLPPNYFCPSHHLLSSVTDRPN